jgi:hypothetical protein
MAFMVASRWATVGGGLECRRPRAAERPHAVSRRTHILLQQDPVAAFAAGPPIGVTAPAEGGP